MKRLLQWARDEFLIPFIQRPRLLQIAALCLRRRDERVEVLLVTSRGTRRWILPKGWPHKRTEDPRSALQEAWEEAGVKEGDVSPEPIGRFRSVKRSDSGLETPCDVVVFRVDVRELTEDFPERDERVRMWVSPAEAAEMVDEPGLAAILRSLPDG